MEDIVWIGNDGQDNSGASTLLYYYIQVPLRKWIK